MYGFTDRPKFHDTSRINSHMYICFNCISYMQMNCFLEIRLCCIFITGVNCCFTYPFSLASLDMCNVCYLEYACSNLRKKMLRTMHQYSDQFEFWTIESVIIFNKSTVIRCTGYNFQFKLYMVANHISQTNVALEPSMCLRCIWCKGLLVLIVDHNFN